MFKKFLMLVVLCIMSTTLAMENILESEEKESFTIYERLPEDAWQLVANDLPSNNLFLNILSRYIKFDENTYKRIIDALFYEIEEIPLASELDTFLVDHYKIAKKQEITHKIRRGLLLALKEHPLFKLRGCEDDIERLDWGTAKFITQAGGSRSILYDRNGLTFNLTTFYDEQIGNIPRLTPEDLHGVINLAALVHLDEKRLADYTSQVKLAVRNVKHLLKMIDQAPVPYNRSDLRAYIKNIQRKFGSIMRNMIWTTLFGIPILVMLSVREIWTHSKALFWFSLFAFYVCFEFNVLSNAYPWPLIIVPIIAVSLAAYMTFKIYVSNFHENDRSYTAIKKKYERMSEQLNVLKKALLQQVEQRKRRDTNGNI